MFEIIKINKKVNLYEHDFVEKLIAMWEVIIMEYLMQNE